MVLDCLARRVKVWIYDVWVFSSSVLLDEVVHVEHTTHPTSIISKEDTSKCSECNDQIGPNGDRSLDPCVPERGRLPPGIVAVYFKIT
jgi:hypothetical protein